MTAQTLKGALSAVAAVIGKVSGVDVSESTQLFNINDTVIALNYVMNSSVEISETGTKQHLALIASDIVTPFVSMTDELDMILGLVDDISTALIREASTDGSMFSNTISTYSFLRIEFLPAYTYNNIPHIGYRLMLEDVKLKFDL